jgi:adenosine deaminase
MTARVLLMVCLAVGWVAPSSLHASGQTGLEQKTSQYLESVRRKPPLLLAFLQEMPKGGDLHNHLFGTIYAESLISFAADDGLCVDRSTLFLQVAPCDRSCSARDEHHPLVSCAYDDQTLYNSIVDAWSMRNWTPLHESGHDHFFATFDKFLPALPKHIDGLLAEEVSRAAADRLQYVELMHTADGDQAAQVGEKVGWSDDFGTLREKLLGGGLKSVVASTRADLDRDQGRMRSLLKCGTPEAAPGCTVEVRFLYQVLRGLPREQVFAQMLLGFELAQADPRFVGLNLVMPEDWYVPMRDFELHMRMLDYLHGIYPKVHISLHAGELAMGLVPPEALRFHIRDSIERGHAERIGHGVSIMGERDPLALLQEMATRNVLVEICLTSNDLILGVSEQRHPLPVYMQKGVPVALATDDQGVARSDMTHEWLRAAESYNLSYSDLKRMARQSLEHSFLPGQSLWSETQNFRMVGECVRDDPGKEEISAECRLLLKRSERARMQWILESEFARFESRY